MEIKGNSFIENMMITAAFSKIKSESTKNKSLSLKNLEMKIINLLDSILSKLSSSYRANRTKITNKIMLAHEEDKKSVNRVIAKVLPQKNQEVETQDQVKKKQKLEKVEQLPEKTVEELPEIFKLNVEGLEESSEEIEKKARDYQEHKSLEEYLRDNPDALEMLSLYQEIDSLEFSEIFEKLFGHLDPDTLSEMNSDIEDIAERYQTEKEEAEFNENIAQNLGALAAVLLTLQAHANIKKEEA